MKYNTELAPLIIPEYGRHIHSMANSLMDIKDDTKRNQQAKVLINIMGNLNTHFRDVEEYKHKLWDHLFIMSDYKLDVESPYPIPQKKEKRERPKIINNTQGTVKYRHYGKFVIDMLKKAPELKNEDTKNKLIISIAN